MLCFVIFSIKARNMCLSFTYRIKNRSASHLAGVSCGTQGRAMSGLVQFGNPTCSILIASLTIFPSGRSRYCCEKSPGSANKHFLRRPPCEREACETVHRKPRTAHKLHYDSFYSECLIHGGFIFVKLSSSQGKRFKNL